MLRLTRFKVAPQIGFVFVQLVRTPPEKRNEKEIAERHKNAEDLWKILDAHLAHNHFVAGTTSWN